MPSRFNANTNDVVDQTLIQGNEHLWTPFRFKAMYDTIYGQKNKMIINPRKINLPATMRYKS